jgi:hypothetical protein
MAKKRPARADLTPESLRPLYVLMEDMQAQIRTVAEGHEITRLHVDKTIGEFQRRVDGRLDRLEFAVRQNSDDIRMLEEEVRRNSEDIRQNGEDIRQNSEDIRILQGDVRTLADRLTPLEQRVTVLEKPGKT